MADNLSDDILGNDNDVSPLSRGVSVAGLVTAGLGFPSLWKTFKEKYPKGIDIFANRFTKNQPTEIELQHAISKTIFEKSLDSSHLIKSIMDKPVLFDERYDKTNTSTWAQMQRKRRRFELITSPEGNQIEQLENMIQKASKDLDIIANDEALQVYRKEAVALYIREIGEKEFLGKFPLMTGFVNGLKSGAMMNTADVNKIFTEVLSQGNSNLLNSLYRDLLKYGRSDNATLLASRSKIVKLLDRPSKYQGRLNINQPTKIDKNFYEFHASKYKTGELFAEEVMGTVHQKIEWSAENRANKVDLKFKNVLKELYNEVHSERSSLKGPGSTFSVRLTNSGGTSNALDRLEIYSIDPGGEKRTFFLDLPKKGYIRGGQRVPQTSIYSGKGFIPSNIIESQVDGLASNVKTIAHALVTETDGKQEVARVQRWFDKQFKTSDLATGNTYLDTAKRGIVSRNDMPWLNASTKALKNRASGLLEYNTLNYVKKTGQDILIYDTEFYTGRAGIQPLVKTPQAARLYQISYRRVSSTGEALTHGNYYIKDASFERLYKAYKSGTTCLELENLKHVLNQTGKGTPEHLDWLIETIQKEGVTPKQALSRVFNEAGKGAAILDFAGKGGSDRALIDYISPEFLKDRTMIDMLKLQKSASSLGSGFRLTHVFTRLVENADEIELNKIVKTLSSHSSTIAHNDLIHKLSKMTNISNRKQMIIQAVTADSHDSSVDVAVTHTALNHVLSDRSQMGSILGFTNMLNKIMNTGFIDFKTRVNMLNYANLAVHYTGKDAAEDALFMSTIPNTVSAGGMLKGKTQMFPYHRLDPLNVQDSSLRQIHQVMNGVRLGYLGEHGHFYDPYTTAFRKNLERQSSNIAENIAIHAEPVMIPTLVIAKGYGVAPDDSITIDSRVLNKTATTVRHREKIVNFKGLKQEGSLFELIHRLTKDKGINIFNEKTTLDADELNHLFDQHFKKEQGELGEAYRHSQANVNNLKGKFYQFEQDTLIAKDISGQEIRSKHTGNTRFSKIRFTRGRNGELQFVYELEELITAEKVRAGFGKGMVFGSGEQGIMGILGHHNDSPAVVSDRLTARSRIKPEMLLSGNLFSRSDVGTTKKLALNRIYGTYMAAGDHTGAQRFLQDLFARSTTYQTGNQSRVLLDYTTVAEALDIANGVKADTLYKHMEKVGLTWDTANIKALAQSHNVTYTADKIEMSKRFDDLTVRMIEKDKLNILDGVKANSTKILDAAMDNEQIKFMRSVYNPYFNFVRNKIDFNHETNGRFIDFTKIKRDGKTVIAPVLLTFSDILSSMSYQMQQQQERQHTISVSSVIEKQMEALQSNYNKSMEKTLIDRMIGQKKRGTRKTILSIFSMLQGADKLSGVSIGEVDINATKQILSRTASYQQLHKYFRENGLGSELQTPAFKKWYHEAFLTTTISDLEIERRDLELKLDNSTPTNRKEIINSIKEVDDRLKGMKTSFKISEESLAIKDIESMTDTLYNHAFRSNGQGEFGDKNIGINGPKVAPPDLILFKSKNFRMDKDFFKMVREQLQVLDENLRTNDPKAFKRREFIDKIINMTESQVKNKGVHDGIILPNAHILMDAMNLSARQLALGSEIPLTRGNLMNSMQNVLSSIMLTTSNEFENSKSSDYFHKRTAKKYAEFLGDLAHRVVGKNGLFSRELELQGTYGLLNSPFAFKKQVGGMVRDHNKLKEIIREKYNKATKDNGFDVRKANTQKIINRHVEREFNASLELNEKIQSGRYNFIARSEFMKHQVNVGNATMSVGKFFEKELKEGRLTKEEIRLMKTGGKSVPVGISRYPLESNMWGLFSGETFVYDQNWAVFQDVRKGTVPSLDTMLMLRADSDGDNIVTRLLNVKNMEELNKVLTERRGRTKDVYEAMFQYQNNLFKFGNTTKAKEITEKMYGKKFQPSEIRSIITLTTEMLEDYGHKVSKDPIIGHKLEELQQSEINKLGNLKFIDASISDLKKFVGSESIQELIEEKTRRFRARVVGQASVGYLSSAASKFKARKDLIMERISLIKDPKLQQDMIKLFPGMNQANENAVKIFGDTMSTMFQDLNNSYDDLIRSLTHQGPEQKAISMKKLTENDAISHVLNVVSHVDDLDNASVQGSFKRLSIDISKDNLKKWRFFQDIHKTLLKSDPNYERQYHDATVDLTHNGKNVMDLLNMSLSARFSQGFEQLTPKELQHAMSAYTESTTPSFGTKVSTAWRNSVKQVLEMKPAKSVLGLGIGLSILSLGSPDQLAGGISSFGIDIGHRPGFKSDSDIGMESLSAEPGQDVFTQKWTYLLNNDPILKDNISALSDRSYKDLTMNKKIYTQFNPSKKFKRNYIDYRKNYNSRYQTNDMRRTQIGM
ncbi:MAG TPA: hypothetical protein VI911_11115 [Patescibacteria group bacterium]|nr:hypothetical protein [Patescibacteria group bacterium]